MAGTVVCKCFRLCRQRRERYFHEIEKVQFTTTFMAFVTGTLFLCWACCVGGKHTQPHTKAYILAHSSPQSLHITTDAYAVLFCAVFVCVVYLCVEFALARYVSSAASCSYQIAHAAATHAPERFRSMRFTHLCGGRIGVRASDFFFGVQTRQKRREEKKLHTYTRHGMCPV